MLTAEESFFLSVFPFSICNFLNDLQTLSHQHSALRLLCKVSFGLPFELAGRAAGLADHLGCR